ncbi:hypothetical protein [uncultured Gammaproteobacteria bacterium]|nr:hypothetical protein [uncultured Gammaproteobacteria bacterium]
MARLGQSLNKSPIGQKLNFANLFYLYFMQRSHGVFKDLDLPRFEFFYFKDAVKSIMVSFIVNLI